MEHVASDDGCGWEVSQREPCETIARQRSHKSQVADNKARKSIRQAVRVRVPGAPPGRVGIPIHNACYGSNHITKCTRQLV
jgi:hypothetical protein